MKRKTKEINGKRILFHRWVVSESLGRSLTNLEVIHHIDGNEKNNDLNNLLLTDSNGHALFHISGRKKSFIPNNKLSLVKIKEILSLHNEGLSYSKIQRKIGIRNQVVGKYVLENK